MISLTGEQRARGSGQHNTPQKTEGGDNHTVCSCWQQTNAVSRVWVSEVQGRGVKSQNVHGV